MNKPEDCEKCGAANPIKNGDAEIPIGDKNGTYASVAFIYCEECGWHGNVEFKD